MENRDPSVFNDLKILGILILVAFLCLRNINVGKDEPVDLKSKYEGGEIYGKYFCPDDAGTDREGRVYFDIKYKGVVVTKVPAFPVDYHYKTGDKIQGPCTKL